MTNTTYTFDDATYSDLYKEAFGFRPRQSGWYTLPDAEKQREWDSLIDIAQRQALEEEMQEQKAALEFESRIQELIAYGAGDREAAIRWVADAYEVNGDLDCLAYKLGLPYRYFVKGI
jgi:hypothetical protein